MNSSSEEESHKPDTTIDKKLDTPPKPASTKIFWEQIKQRRKTKPVLEKSRKEEGIVFVDKRTPLPHR